MKKFLLIGLTLMLVFSLLWGCGGSGEEAADLPLEDTNGVSQEENGTDKTEMPRPQGVEITRELEQMVNHFKNAGLQIGEYHEKSYEIIGASAGFGLEVEGQEIELYYYDPNKTDQEVLDNLKNKHNPDATFAIVINGYYELALALHPEQERIIEVFMSY